MSNVLRFGVTPKMKPVSIKKACRRAYFWACVMAFAQPLSPMSEASPRAWYSSNVPLAAWVRR